MTMAGSPAIKSDDPAATGAKLAALYGLPTPPGLLFRVPESVDFEDKDAGLGFYAERSWNAVNAAVIPSPTAAPN